MPIRAQSGWRVADCPFPTSAAGAQKKRYTYYFSNLDKRLQAGGVDASEWTNYFHAYRNDVRGLTYPILALLRIQHKLFVGNANAYRQSRRRVGSYPIRFVPGSIIALDRFGYSGTEACVLPWSRVVCHGDHVIILAAKGGHTSELATARSVSTDRRLHRPRKLERWKGVLAQAERLETKPSPVVELEPWGKNLPMPGMEFLLYSGLWGSREKGAFGFFNYWLSGSGV